MPVKYHQSIYRKNVAETDNINEIGDAQKNKRIHFT